MIREKTLMDVPGYEGQEVVIKRLNYGEKSDLTSITTKISVEGTKKQETIIDAGQMRIWTVVFGVKTAPFFKMAAYDQREREARALDDDAGKYIFSEVNDLNSEIADKDIKKKSPEQQPEKTPPAESPTNTLEKQS